MEESKSEDVTIDVEENANWVYVSLIHSVMVINVKRMLKRMCQHIAEILESKLAMRISKCRALYGEQPA